MLNVGDLAPVFTAASTKGTIDLAAHIGKETIVLIFYPGDDTPICTKQLCGCRITTRKSSKQIQSFLASIQGVWTRNARLQKGFAMNFH